MNIDSNQLSKIKILFEGIQTVAINNNPLKKLDCFEKSLSYDSIAYVNFSNCKLEEIVYIPGGQDWSLEANEFKDLKWIKNCSTN